MIKTLRVSYWMFLGFVRKHTGLLILGIILGSTGVFLLPKIFNYLPKPKPSEKIAIIGNPTLSEIPMFIQKQISLGLTETDLNGEAKPSVAKSIKVEEDGKRFIFTLKENLVWHDGKPFTSEDINYNFSDVEMEILSPYEVAFKLKDPFSPFPTIVNQPLFRQKKSFLFQSRTSLIGLGPFKVKSISKSGHLISKITLESDKKKVTYKFYNTQETAKLAFKLGEVDKILELSTPGELATWPNVTVEEAIHYDRYVAVFFNTEDPYLSSKTFRQALAYAIPNKPENEERALSPINPNSWAYNPQVKPYIYNLELAKQLIDSEKEEREDFDPTIEMTTTLPHLEMAEKIKLEWEKIGVKTNIKVVSYLPEDIQALLIAQEIPPDPDQYSFWHSTQHTNLTNYNSPKVDKELEDGRQTLEQKERILIYQDFQRFLVEDSPAAFLYHHKTYTISR